jgi:teichuronic acid biosynthesis protein TuaE
MLNKVSLNPISALFWMLIVTAFTGTLFLTFSIGPVHLFPFRAVLILIWVLFLVKRGRVNLASIHVKKSLIFFLIWFGYATFSILWAASKIEAFKHIIFLFLSFSLIFFMILNLRQRKDLDLFVKLWLTVFAILIPIAIWETMTGNHLQTSGLNYADEGYEFYKFAPTGLFANQNDYATFLAFSMPMLLSRVQYERNRLIRLLLLVLFVGGGIILLFTTSRANYAAIIISTLFWFVAFTGIVQKFRFLLGGLILLTVVLVNLNEQSWFYLQFVWEDLSVLSEGTQDSGLDVRSNLIKSALYYTIATFGFGVGAGNIEYYLANFPIHETGPITNIHNWWLENLANYGFIFMSLYFAFFFSLFYSLWKVRKHSPYVEIKSMAEAMICLLVAFPISSISSSSLIAFNPHWLIFGFMLALVNFHRNGKMAKE